VELGIAQGKKMYDKRDDEADKAAKLESARASKLTNRYN